MRKLLYINILFVLCFAGCRKKAKINLPTTEVKLVLTCFISPEDSILYADLRTSTPKIGELDFVGGVIDYGTVRLSSASKTIDMIFNYQYGGYVVNVSDFPIVPGQSYSITASAPNFQPVSATTSIPEDTLHITNIDISVGSKTQSYEEVFLSYGVQDLPGRTYVALLHQLMLAHDSSSYRLILSNVRYWETANYFDDVKQNKSFYYSKRTNEKLVYGYGKYALVFTALNYSHELYYYSRSVQLALESSDNPFAEPVMIYSNINGGYGCFGGYRSTSRKVLHW